MNFGNIFGGWESAGRQLYQGISEGISEGLEIAYVELTDYAKDIKKKYYDKPQAEAELTRMRDSTRRVEDLRDRRFAEPGDIEMQPRDIVLNETRNILEDLHELPEMDGKIGAEEYSTRTEEGLENALKIIQDAKWNDEMKEAPIDMELLETMRAERNFVDRSSIELQQILPEPDVPLSQKMTGTGITPFDLELYRNIGEKYPEEVEMMEMRVDISDLPKTHSNEFYDTGGYSYFDDLGIDTLEFPGEIELGEMRRVDLDAPRFDAIDEEEKIGDVEDGFFKENTTMDDLNEAQRMLDELELLDNDGDVEDMFFADSMEDVSLPTLEDLSGELVSSVLMDSVLAGALELGVNTVVGTVPFILVDQFVDLFTKTGKWGEQLFKHDIKWLEETEKSVGIERNYLDSMFGKYLDLSKKIRQFYKTNPKYCWIRDNGICGQKELPAYSISDLAFVFKKLTKTGLWIRCRIITLEGQSVGLLDDKKLGYNFFLKPANRDTKSTFDKGEFGFFFRLGMDGYILPSSPEMDRRCYVSNLRYIATKLPTEGKFVPPDEDPKDKDPPVEELKPPTLDEVMRKWDNMFKIPKKQPPKKAPPKKTPSFIPKYRKGQKWNKGDYKIVLIDVPTNENEHYKYIQFNRFEVENEIPEKSDISEAWLTEWIRTGVLTKFTPFLEPDDDLGKDKFTAIKPKEKETEKLPTSTIVPFQPKYHLMQKWNVGDDGEWKMVLVKVPNDKTDEYGYVLVDRNWESDKLEGAFTFVSEEFIDNWLNEGEISEYTPFSEIPNTENKLPLTKIGQFKKQRIRTGIPFMNHRSLMMAESDEPTQFSRFFEEFRYYHTRSPSKFFEPWFSTRKYSYRCLALHWFEFLSNKHNYLYRYVDQNYIPGLPKRFRRLGLKGEDENDRWNDETQQIVSYASVPRFFVEGTGNILCQRSNVETILERDPSQRCYETLHLIGDCLKLDYWKCYGPTHFTRKVPLPINRYTIFDMDCNFRGFPVDFEVPEDQDGVFYNMEEDERPDDVVWYTSRLRNKDTRAPFFCNNNDSKINEALEANEWFFYRPEHFQTGLYVEPRTGVRIWPLIDTYYQISKRLIEWNTAVHMKYLANIEWDIFEKDFAYEDPLFIDILKKSVRSNNQEHYKRAEEFSIDEINERINQINYITRCWAKIYNTRLNEQPRFLQLLEIERDALRKEYQNKIPEPDYPLDTDFEHELLEIDMLQRGRSRQVSPRFQSLPPTPNRTPSPQEQKQGSPQASPGLSDVPSSLSRSISPPYNFEEDFANHDFKVPQGADQRDRLILFAQHWIHFLKEDPFWVPDFHPDVINRWFRTRLRPIFRAWIENNEEEFSVHPVDFVNQQINNRLGFFTLNLNEQSRLEYNENKTQLEMTGIAYPESEKTGAAASIEIRRKEQELFRLPEFKRFHTLFNEWATHNPLDADPTPSPTYTRTPASLTRSRSVSRRSQTSINPEPNVQPSFRPVTPYNPTDVPALSSGGSFRPLVRPRAVRGRPSLVPSTISQTVSELDRARTQWSPEYIASAERVRNTSIFEENITWSWILAMVLIFLILWSLLTRRRR